MHDQTCWPATANIRTINRYSLNIFRKLTVACHECAVVKFNTTSDIANLICHAGEKRIERLYNTCSQPLVSLRDYHEQVHQAAFASVEVNSEWHQAIESLRPDIHRLNALVLHTIRELSRADLLATATIFAAPISVVSRVGDLSHEEIYSICDQIRHPILKLREDLATWRRLLMAREKDGVHVSLITAHILTKGVSELCSNNNLNA